MDDWMPATFVCGSKDEPEKGRYVWCACRSGKQESVEFGIYDGYRRFRMEEGFLISDVIAWKYVTFPEFPKEIE